jgi:hypothetical protein
MFEKVEIENFGSVPFAEVLGDRIVFLSNGVVVPRHDDDPDGGRSIYHAATVVKDGKDYAFQYREKYYEGLEVWEDGKQLNELPEWALQAED